MDSGNVGHSRVEWFPLFLGASATVPASCLSSVNAMGHGSAFSGVTQLIIDAEWTRIEVTPRTLLVLWGNVGGAWASSLEVAGIAFLLYNLYARPQDPRGVARATISFIRSKKPKLSTSTTSATTEYKV